MYNWKEVSIDKLKIGDDVKINGKSGSTITYIGVGVGCYKDRFNIEFPFSTRHSTFEISIDGCDCEELGSKCDTCDSYD